MIRRMVASRRLLGSLLLLLGGGIFAVTLFSVGTDVPRDATWIFVPQDRVPTDYALESITLRLDLTNSSYSVLSVEIGLMVFNKTRDYGLGILQPLPVVEERASASNPNGRTSDPVTSVTPSGSYFTRSRYSFEYLGYTSISLNVPLLDPITSWEFGRRGTGFTFGSGLGFQGFGPEVNQFMRDTTTSEVLNRGLTLSIIYPPSWMLSVSETFPQPDKQFAVGKDRVATWFLDFHEILPAYFETASIIWTVPEELRLQNWANFFSGIMIGIGSGMVAESVRHRTQR